MGRVTPTTLRDELLDAAERVLRRDGYGNLTLDAVAGEAGISKGGLLHHYPSKDRLIQGLVARTADGWRACCMGAYEQTPEGPGRMARALLGHISDAAEWDDQCRRSSSAVFGALVQNPTLIEPMRAVYSDIRRRLEEDGLPAGVGETVAAAIDGLWLYWVLGLVHVDQALMGRVRGALENLLAQCGAGPRKAATAPRNGDVRLRGAERLSGRRRKGSGRTRGGSR